MQLKKLNRSRFLLVAGLNFEYAVSRRKRAGREREGPRGGRGKGRGAFREAALGGYERHGTAAQGRSREAPHPPIPHRNVHKIVYSRIQYQIKYIGR